MIQFKKEIKQIAEEIKAHGGRMFVVGGAVRDDIRGVPCVDQDFMVQGIEESKAKEIIAKFGKISEADVISNAPVFIARIDGEDFEFAFARIEKSVRPGKSGFEFISHPGVTVRQDMERRDVTAGAIAVDIITSGRIDFFNGVSDIKNGIIRAVQSFSFVQSPERAFRAFSHSARFGWDIEPNTVRIIRSMKPDFNTIPREQIWRHFEKAGKHPAAPEKFIEAMVACEWIEFFPEIHVDSAIRALKGGKFGVEAFLAAVMAGMSFEEEIAFSERICCPKQIFKAACDIKSFGEAGRPKRWVEGRDIAHVVSAGKSMGEWVNWCWVRQINGIASSKEENIKWVEQSVKEGK